MTNNVNTANAQVIAHLREKLAAGVGAVFTEALDAKAVFAMRLMALGIGSAQDARPYAVLWAAEKYNVPVYEGQRCVVTLDPKAPNYEAAKKAVARVLLVIFGGEDTGPKESAKTDKVERLIAAFMKLDATDKARAIKGINAAMKAVSK